jgi:aromatic-L-amino-acid decarboxylase
VSGSGPCQPTYPLEPAAEELRHLIDRAAERIVSHVTSLPSQPATYEGALSGELAAVLARSVREPMPEEGEGFESLLDLLFERLVPESFNTAGPGYLAYIPGGGVLAAAVADLIADAVNRYVGVWIAAPGLAELEANVIRWFCRMVGYPAEARGFLSTGGSLANFTAVVVARGERLPQSFLSGTLYAGDQVHHSVVKAAALAGFPAGNVRLIPSDDRFRVRVDLLAEAIAADRRAGLTPFLLVGSAGTTNTGAVDDLPALADLAGRQGLWLHLDAAYGGFFLLTERGRRAMPGIERADSLTLDPHKGLFLPYGTGCLLVRDGRALHRAHRAEADYMPVLQRLPSADGAAPGTGLPEVPPPDLPEFTDFCEISPELSRGFRGLRVWLPLKLHGARAFRAALDEKLDLAAWATEELAKIPGVAVVARPQLSIVAFRLVVAGRDAGQLDRLNRELLARVNARRRVYLTGTVVGDRFVLRFCILSFRTHRDRIEQALEDVRAAAAELERG